MTGAERMLLMKVGLLDMLRSSEGVMLEMVSDGTPLTSVPRDSREEPESICKTSQKLTQKHKSHSSSRLIQSGIINMLL